MLGVRLAAAFAGPRNGVSNEFLAATARARIQAPGSIDTILVASIAFPQELRARKTGNAVYPANVRASFATAAGRPRMRIATPSSPYSSATPRAFS
jgi:hypothetical protein